MPPWTGERGTANDGLALGTPDITFRAYRRPAGWLVVHPLGTSVAQTLEESLSDAIERLNAEARRWGAR